MQPKGLSFATIISLLVRNLEIAFRRWLNLPPRPYKFLLELTEHCNSRCQTCDIWKKPEAGEKASLSLKHAERLLSDFGKHTLWLALSGGEITLYKDFPELALLIRKYCPHLKLVTFTTNGLNPTKALEFAKILKNLGADIFVTVSLDGDEMTHDQIRGIDGNYAKAHQTFQLLSEANITAHWGLTVSELNKKFIENDRSLIPKIKAFTFAHSHGIYKKENTISNHSLVTLLSKISSAYKISTLGEAFEWVYVRLARSHIQLNKKNLIPCEVIGTSLHIRPNGNIQPCMFVNSLGSLESDSVSSLLQTPALQTKMADYRKGKCPGCWMNCYAPHSMMQHPWRSLFYAFVPLKKELRTTKPWRTKIAEFMTAIRKTFDPSEI